MAKIVRMYAFNGNWGGSQIVNPRKQNGKYLADLIKTQDEKATPPEGWVEKYHDEDDPTQVIYKKYGIEIGQELYLELTGKK